jgi:hypothetical protein
MLAASQAKAQGTGAAAGRRYGSDDWDGDYGQKAERRSDFTVGAAGGLLLGNARGYPNEADRIDRPEFEQNTGFGYGSQLGGWIGVAFNDYLSFGLGGIRIQASGNDLTASGGAFLTRVEGFPLFALGGAWRDMGATASFGLGFLDIDQGQTTVAEGGSMSILALGVFHETLRLGHFTVGPSIEYSYGYSQTLKLHSALVALRTAFYGGP